jgi:hypothetical protein
MRNYAPKVLFFINGPLPSDGDRTAARELGPGVTFRNVNAVPLEVSPGSLEAAHGVAGDVPAAYSRYPRGLDGVKAWAKDNPDKADNFEFPQPSVPENPLPPAAELRADFERRQAARSAPSAVPAATGGTSDPAATWPAKTA